MYPWLLPDHRSQPERTVFPLRPFARAIDWPTLAGDPLSRQIGDGMIYGRAQEHTYEQNRI